MKDRITFDPKKIHSEKYVRDLLESRGIDTDGFKMFTIRPKWERLERKGHINLPHPHSRVNAIVTVEGMMYNMSGFAEALRNVAYYMKKSGVNVLTDPTDTKNADNVDISKTTKGKFIDTYASNGFRSIKPRIRVQMTIPMGIKRRMKSEYNIAYVMFETKDMPSKYVDHLEKECDEIWVPSKFNEDGFLRAGWKKPIFVMPLGADTRQFHPGVKPLQHKFAQFTFLSIMGWSERKGVSLLIEAFCEAFTRKDNVVLRIKGGWYDEYKANKEVEAIASKYPNPPRIIVDFHIYTNEEMPRLYASADAFVLPSRGEGWGLNYTEAMSMGLPTIGTAATSMLDFMNDFNSFTIPIKGWATEPRCDWVCDDYVGQKFAVPDMTSLIKILKYVYENPGACKLRGNQARKDMVDIWSWKNASGHWNKRLEEIAENL